MNKTLALMILTVAVLVLGCVKQPDKITNDGEPVICTADAKLCPDGSAVGRDSNNNCAFPACPADDTNSMVDPYTKYVSEDADECKTMLFQCIEGSSPFNDETGCGCTADEPKTYVSYELSQCEVIRYMCVKNHVAFTDEKGCGCEFTFEQAADEGSEPVPDESTSGKLKAYDCDPNSPKGEGVACTMDYNPVCGWFNAEIQCIKYPCASTFGNACGACASENVAYYTMGECPTDDGKLA